MTVIPAFDGRGERPASNGLPANIEAEQALLGCLLYDNAAFHMIEGVDPEHFHEPAHGRLYAAIRDALRKGRLAEPIGVGSAMRGDQALDDLGGVNYLALLVDRAPPPSNAPEFARIVIDMAKRRALIALGGEIAQGARDAEGEPDDVIGLAEAELLAMQVQSRPMKLLTAGEASARVLADLDAPPEQAVGVHTGIAPLDDQLGPLLAGDLVLLMGRPGMGKSAAAECIALNMSQTGVGVIQINGEMTVEQMTRRHLADLCQARWGARGPKYSDMRKRAVTFDQRRMLQSAHDVLTPLPLLMLKRSGLKLSQLRSLARRQAAAWARHDVPLGALIVDHVGLIHPDQPTRDRYADQTLISNAMKELADELQAPLICLNQMNRQNENRDDKRPQTHDLRDSGSWEQDADFIVGFYREAYYAQKQPEPQITKSGKAGDEQHAAWAEWDRARRSPTIEAIVLKAREGGTDTVKLWGDVARNAIRGAAPEDGDLV